MSGSSKLIISHISSSGDLRGGIVTVMSGSGGLKGGLSVPPVKNYDTNFFVSGTVGSRGSTARVRGTSTFGGDLCVSGTLYVGHDSSGKQTLNVYANVDGDYAALIDNDQNSNGHVLKLSTDGNGTGSRLLDMVDGDGDTLFRARADGRFGFGATGVSSMGAGTFVVGIDGGHTSDIAISKRLQHLGDSNTYMDFTTTDQIEFVAGGVDMIHMTEDDSQDMIVFNEGGADVDFRVESSSEDEAIFLNAGANELHINKGKSAFATHIYSNNDEAVSVKTAGVIINESGHAGNDFRVESDTETHALFVDAGANELHINSGETAFLTTIHNVDGEAVSVTATEVVINDDGVTTVDFRVESDGEDEALFLDASANTLYVNKGNTAFATEINSTNDVAITVGAAGVIFNEDGHATNDFRVESDEKTHAIFVDAGANSVQILTAGSRLGGSSVVGTVGDDVSFQVSGSKGKLVDYKYTGRTTPEGPGRTVIGGDLFISGAIVGGWEQDFTAYGGNRYYEQQHVADQHTFESFYGHGDAGLEEDWASMFSIASSHGKDIFFYASGSRGGKQEYDGNRDNFARSVAVFRGDLVVSGTIYAEQSDSGMSVYKASASHDLGAGATDTQNTRAASVTITVNGNIAADDSIGDLTISSDHVSAWDTIVASTSVSGITVSATAVTNGSFKLSFFNDSGAQVNNDSTFVCNWIAL